MEQSFGRSLLLTGGTGFIGRFLVPVLLRRGWQVVVLSRQPAGAVAALLGGQVKTIRTLQEWPNMPGPDACINLAGEGIMDRRWTVGRKRVLRGSRVGLTRDLVTWLNARPQPPRVLISGSAVGYYGPRASGQEVDEQEPAGTDFAARLCADWEQAARQVSSQSRLCLLRTGVVLHPQHGALARMLPAFRWGLGGPVGSGRQMMPWIHIDDMVRAIEFLLDHPDAQGVFNCVAPEQVAQRSFARTLGQALGRPAVLPVPALVLQCLLGEGATLLLEGQGVVPTALCRSGFEFSYPTLSAALRGLTL